MSAFWESSTGPSTLTITSPKLAPRIGSVPDEMIKAHAQYEIKKELFKKPLVTFAVKTTGSQSFDSYISTVFGKNETEYQQTTVEVGAN